MPLTEEEEFELLSLERERSMAMQQQQDQPAPPQDDVMPWEKYAASGNQAQPQEVSIMDSAADMFFLLMIVCAIAGLIIQRKRITKYIQSRKGLERVGVFFSALMVCIFSVFFAILVATGGFNDSLQQLLHAFFAYVISCSALVVSIYALFWGINWLVKGYK